MIFGAARFLQKRNAFWYTRPDGRPNAGDELAREIVESVLRIRDKSLLSPKRRSGRILSIGSVMHFARNGDIVWGTGVNGKVKTGLHRFTALDVRAVRGPRTRRFLIERGISVPEIYGDPGLLAPCFYPIRWIPPTRDQVVYVPHMNDKGLPQNCANDVSVVSPLQGPGRFIGQLLCASRVISASLHGVILGEAFGIPTIWLRADSTESDFKYFDYFEGTGRHNARYATDFADALEAEPTSLVGLDMIQDGLLTTFPHDVWEVE